MTASLNWSTLVSVTAQSICIIVTSSLVVESEMKVRKPKWITFEDMLDAGSLFCRVATSEKQTIIKRFTHQHRDHIGGGKTLSPVEVKIIIALLGQVLKLLLCGPEV